MTTTKTAWTEEQIAKWINDGQDSAKLKAHKLSLKEQQAKQVVMKVTTKYVITDTPNLISPIGYMCCEPVYLQTTVAIHTDSLDGFKIPGGTTLYAHDVEKIIAKHSSNTG